MLDIALQAIRAVSHDCRLLPVATGSARSKVADESNGRSRRSVADLIGQSSGVISVKDSE